VPRHTHTHIYIHPVDIHPWCEYSLPPASLDPLSRDLAIPPRSTSSPYVPRHPTLILPSLLDRILATGAKGTEPIPGITRGRIGLEWEGKKRETVHMASTTENTQFPFLDDDPKALSILVFSPCFLIPVYTIIFLFQFKHGHISPTGRCSARGGSVPSMASMALHVLFEEGGRSAGNGGGREHRGHLPWGTGMRQTSLLGQGWRRMCWRYHSW
jgi:hypothetical protein